MNKPVILFDADGVLLDFMTPALRVAEEVIFRVTGAMTTIKPEDLDSWDLFDTIGRKYESTCYVEYKKKGFCESIQPYPGAVEGLREARTMADIVIVTSALDSETWDFERKASLHRHFGIPKNDVIFSHRKSLVVGRMLIDDRPSHARSWAKEHYARGIGVLWDQPYNRLEAIGENVLRCGTWDGPGGLLDVIEHVAQGG